MKFITQDKTIDFEELGYKVLTINKNTSPSTRSQSFSVIDRDSQHIFKDGLNNKQLDIRLALKDSSILTQRQFNFRSVKRELLKEGKLILNEENDMYYNARVLSQSDVEFSAGHDRVNISFNVDPLSYTRIEEGMTWDEVDIDWFLFDETWQGDFQETYTLTTDDTITVENIGTYESLPVIEIDADGSVTIADDNGNQFTYSGSVKVYVDCDNRIVYDASNNNEITNFTFDSGDGFIELNSGDNTLDISGTFTSLTLKFNNKDVYV